MVERRAAVSSPCGGSLALSPTVAPSVVAAAIFMSFTQASSKKDKGYAIPCANIERLTVREVDDDETLPSFAHSSGVKPLVRYDRALHA